VLSSPAMIMHMEKTAVDAVRSSLPANTATVGFHVDVKHIAPAAPGAHVVTHARLVGVDGNKLTFEVTAHESERLLGTGTHRRAIVPV
jgi:fluoroacetyl-CoA thioesterase